MNPHADDNTKEDQNVEGRPPALPLPGGEGRGEGERFFPTYFGVGGGVCADSKGSACSRRRLRAVGGPIEVIAQKQIACSQKLTEGNHFNIDVLMPNHCKSPTPAWAGTPVSGGPV